MGKMTQEWTDSLKSSDVYATLKAGISSGYIQKILLGEKPYSIAAPSHPVSQDAAMIFSYLHTLHIHGDAERDVLEQGLGGIAVTPENISLLLSYVHFYLIYQEHNSELTLDPLPVVEKIKACPHYDSSCEIVEGIMEKIDEFLIKFEGANSMSNSVGDAAPYFILAVVGAIEKPHTFVTLTELFNRKLNIHTGIKPFVDKLLENGWLKHKPDSHAYRLTGLGLKCLLEIDLSRMVNTLKPAGAGESVQFYEGIVAQFTKLEALTIYDESSGHISKNDSQQDHRREVIRWILHDNDISTPIILEQFIAWINDPDWEVRMSVLLGSVKLGMTEMLPYIAVVKLPDNVECGLSSLELDYLVQFRDAAIDLLLGAPVPEEPLKLETEKEWRQYYTRLVGRGSMKLMHDAFLLYTSLTFPCYPIQEYPKSYHRSIKRKKPRFSREVGDFYLNKIELKFFPEYTSFIGSSTIAYHTVKLSRLPEGTFVSKDPITWGQLLVDPPEAESEHDFALVTWDEAKQFCKSLSEKCGITISIPNSESWEIAIRGHSGRIYPWGNSYEHDQLMQPNMWGLTNYFSDAGEWTSDSIKDGRVICKGADRSMRCAPLQFNQPESKRHFRVILCGLKK